MSPYHQPNLASSDRDRRTWDFNCHSYAFGLSSTEEYWIIRERNRSIWPDGEFVKTWLGPHLTERPRESVEDGDLAVYFSGRRVTHSGVVSGDGIISKWGTAHTWRHLEWEIPICFGFEARYYQRLSIAEVIQLYQSYATAA